MDNCGDILQLCRLCLVKDNVNTPIFEEQGDIGQIFGKISSCLPVTVAHDDKLPQNICDSCTSKLDIVFEFWNTSTNAEKQLLDWIKQETSNQTIAQEQPSGTIVKEENDESQENQIILHEETWDQASSSAGPSATVTSEGEPPPKRARRAAAMKAALTVMAAESEDEDDLDLEPMTKVEDETDDEDDPAFGDVPSTSPDNQPGPSGVGKDGIEAPFHNKSKQMAYKKIKLKKSYVLVKRLALPRSTYFFTCSHCDVVYKNKSSIDLHKVVHSGARRRDHLCYNCSERFSTLEELQQHQQKHADEQTSYTSDDSDSITLSSTSSGSSLSSDNGNIDTQDQPTPIFNGPNINTNTFSSLCTTCKINFATTKEAKDHSLVNPKCYYKCGKCEIIVSIKSFLHHLYIHKRYLCNNCGESFDDPFKLRKHTFLSHKEVAPVNEKQTHENKIVVPEPEALKTSDKSTDAHANKGRTKIILPEAPALKTNDKSTEVHTNKDTIVVPEVPAESPEVHTNKEETVVIEGPVIFSKPSEVHNHKENAVVSEALPTISKTSERQSHKENTKILAKLLTANKVHSNKEKNAVPAPLSKTSTEITVLPEIHTCDLCYDEFKSKQEWDTHMAFHQELSKENKKADDDDDDDIISIEEISPPTKSITPQYKYIFDKKTNTLVPVSTNPEITSTIINLDKNARNPKVDVTTIIKKFIRIPKVNKTPKLTAKQKINKNQPAENKSVLRTSEQIQYYLTKTLDNQLVVVPQTPNILPNLNNQTVVLSNPVSMMAPTCGPSDLAIPSTSTSNNLPVPITIPGLLLPAQAPVCTPSTSNALNIANSDVQQNGHQRDKNFVHVVPDKSKIRFSKANTSLYGQSKLEVPSTNRNFSESPWEKPGTSTDNNEQTVPSIDNEQETEREQQKGFANLPMITNVVTVVEDATKNQEQEDDDSDVDLVIDLPPNETKKAKEAEKPFIKVKSISDLIATENSESKNDEDEEDKEPKPHKKWNFPIKCECGTTMRRYRAWRRHNDNKKQCIIEGCTYRACKQIFFKFHYMSAHNLHYCVRCGFSSPRESVLLQHLLNVHRCKLCNRNVPSVEMHMPNCKKKMTKDGKSEEAKAQTSEMI